MAGRLPDAWLDELRNRLDIVDIVSDYVSLKQKGRRYWGLCPFHNEKTPSFSVDPDAQMYYCFGCHQGGTAIQFVMQLERMEFLEAVTMLAERVHLPLPERMDGPREGPSRELKERLYEANQAAAKYYHNLLWTPEGAPVLNYLHKRGLDDADIRKFGIGASSTGWTDLLDALTAQGFLEDELLKAGLIGRKETRSYDMFRNRAMFPIIDAHGHVLGFGGRAMGDSTPKYLNTQDTPVFNKRQGLYAINMVKKEGQQSRLVLVEGYMDVVSLRRIGVKGVVATLGTALTEEQAKLIKRYAGEVWVSYDGDSAGQKAILRALDIFESQSMKARVLMFPDELDPDDFVKMYGLTAFEQLKPMDPIDYRMTKARQDYDMTQQEGRTQYAIRAAEMLRKVRNPVELENYVARLMVDTGFTRDVLIDQIGTSRLTPEQKKSPSKRGVQNTPVLQEYERAERGLLALLAGNLIPISTVSPNDFETPVNRQVAEMLEQGMGSAAILDQLQDGDRNLAAAALNAEVLPDEKNALTYAEDCLNTIRTYRIENAIAQQTELLTNAQGEERKALMAQMMQLTQELDRLKTSRKG